MTKLTWAPDGGDAAVADALAAVVAAPGRKILAFPGGATPKAIFARLAARDLPWDSVTLWPTDDRLVPPSHRASNIGGLAKAFGGAGAHLQPLALGLVPPHFDVVWIGMGADGHVASLFPNIDPDPKAPAGVIRVAPVPLPADAPFDRLSLTFAALVEATSIILVVRGADKRALLEAADAGQNDLPIARLLAVAKAPVTAYWSP
ncbi:6-phosphogluconolactonase [Sphingosinicellaceae bacterium]|nr:6-phosphogluconolactonase [Sphingosinicellaceae bacterium]